MALTPYSSLPPGYRTDSRLGPVYETNQQDADDLTVIHGIETREAVGLNHLGVYYFDQIAAWSDEQVTAVADTMGMSAASIFRHRWIEQAWALIAPPASASVSVLVEVFNDRADRITAGVRFTDRHCPGMCVTDRMFHCIVAEPSGIINHCQLFLLPK